MKRIHADVSIINGLSDDGIKEYCRKELMNGGYVTMVCKGCGMYYCDPEGKTENCKIVDMCKHCFEERSEIM